MSKIRLTLNAIFSRIYVRLLIYLIVTRSAAKQQHRVWVVRAFVLQKSFPLLLEFSLGLYMQGSIIVKDYKTQIGRNQKLDLFDLFDYKYETF